MRPSHVLLAGASAASAAGNVYERFMMAPTPVVVKRDEAECSSAILELMPLFSDVPTPDPSLIEYIEEEFATITDPCAMPTFDGQMGDLYTSWLSDMESYYLDKTDEVSSILAACTDVPGIQDQFDYNPEDICGNDDGRGPPLDDDDDDDVTTDEDDSGNSSDDNGTPTGSDDTPTITGESESESDTTGTGTSTGTGSPASETGENDSAASREKATMMMGGLLLAGFVAVGAL